MNMKEEGWIVGGSAVIGADDEEISSLIIYVLLSKSIYAVCGIQTENFESVYVCVCVFV